MNRFNLTSLYRNLKVKCRSSMYPVAVNCFWTHFPPLNDTIHVEYIATYRVGYNKSAETKTCFQETPSSPTCILDEIVVLSKEPHVLNVTAILPGGINTTLFPFVPEEFICSQRAPVSMGIWSRSLPTALQGTYLSRVGPTEDTTLIIKALQPKGKYCIQVKAQHYLDYGQPSEWSPAAVYTITPFK
ncbi:PREDICTED: interleukin-27 subunit beta-like [Elephantulus edwardii]|uniref:interleukin-27 subunit beta-like n=1 Tax=Elephantulus edwardii TaxID=28737 RepID=UPI0003F083B4|nr:PREDICTED: interleukin-27 subunit beta-like [Elephantulus edwardii]